MDPDSTSLALPLIGYACFTLLAAFFSAAERSFMGLNDSLLQRQAAEGDAVARRIARMIEKPAVFLSTVRAGNTLCEMLGLACLSPVATRLFIARVYAGAATPDWAYPAFLLVVTLLIGALSLTLGDILPGRIGDFFPEGAARRLSGPMRLFSLLLRPLVWLMLALAGLGLRLLGQNPDKEPDTVTEEEIRMLVTVGEEKGAIEQSERQMINNIFEFDDRFVTEVMTHRMEMTALEDTATLDEAVAVARQTGYSRIPVYTRTSTTSPACSTPRICSALSTTATTPRALSSGRCSTGPSSSRTPPSAPSCSGSSSRSSCTWPSSSTSTAAPMAW